MRLETAAERGLHTVHSLVLAFPIALFSAGLVADIAYLRTAEIQWTNFAAWLIVGALVFGGVAAAWALASLVIALRSPQRTRRLIYFGVLAAMWLLGLVNAFKHSQDGWSSVGALGVILSILCTVLALVAGVMAYTPTISREIAR
jgi:uncharacterized membrane protein